MIWGGIFAWTAPRNLGHGIGFHDSELCGRLGRRSREMACSPFARCRSHQVSVLETESFCRQHDTTSFPVKSIFCLNFWYATPRQPSRSSWWAQEGPIHPASPRQT